MKHYSIIFIFSVIAGLSIASCKKDDQTAEENITDVVLHLTGPGFDQEFAWRDTDGDGVANTVDSLVIPPLTGNIACHIHVYDKSQTPELDITEEIEEESADHLFTYTITGLDGKLTLSNLNTDANGNPFGITSAWETGQPGNGSLTLRLYHEPTNKSNSADPGGSVDFEGIFPVVIR